MTRQEWTVEVRCGSGRWVKAPLRFTAPAAAQAFAAHLERRRGSRIAGMVINAARAVAL